MDELKRAGALIAAQRRRETRPCSVCGKDMPNTTSRRKFCSNACKMKDRYERRRDAAQKGE